MYRCVKANESNDVIAIGMDEGQGGQDYQGLGIWSTFTFDLIPEIPVEVLEVEGNRCLLKVEGETVVPKTLQEMTSNE